MTEPAHSRGQRPRVLFLSQSLPYPPTSGVTNRTFNILRQLQREFDVSLLAFSRLRHQPDESARQRARARLAETVAWVGDPVPIGSQSSRFRQIWDHLRSVATRRAYTYYEYSSPSFEQQVVTAREKAFDLVHLDSLDLYRWAGGHGSAPVVCTHHNIESDLLRIRARHLKNPLLARYVAHQGALTERVERQMVPDFALNLMMSDVDEQRLLRLAPTARTAVIPNGVDTDALRPKDESLQVPGRVAFLGPLYMFPNHDGVSFFVERVWPLVLQRRPAATLHLIGAASDSHKAAFDRHPGVRCLGFVPDIQPELAAAACCVVPLRVGGGTRLKLLDYWALGKAVVSTTIGAEGLDLRDGDNILLRDDAEGFADAVVAVLDDRDLRSRLGTGARRTAETTYDWSCIGDSLLALYRRLI